MSDVERLARVYSEITGFPVVPKLRENLGRLVDLAAVGACDEAVLRSAAESLQGGPGQGFPVAEWGRAVRRVSALAGAGADSARVVLALSLPLGAPRPLRLMLEEVGGYVDESMERLNGRFSSELLAEGRSRILSRALTADFRNGALARAARLLAEIGDCRSRFPTVQALTTLAGAAPSTRQSGKVKVVGFRWAVDKQLRGAVMDFAGDSHHANPWAADLYWKARQRGKDHSHATRILARAWLMVIWRCWQNREAYDPARHRAYLALQKPAA